MNSNCKEDILCDINGWEKEKERFQELIDESDSDEEINEYEKEIKDINATIEEMYIAINEIDN